MPVVTPSTNIDRFTPNHSTVYMSRDTHRPITARDKGSVSLLRNFQNNKLKLETNSAPDLSANTSREYHRYSILFYYLLVL